MENPNLVDIDGYEKYKFDTELQQVYSLYTNKYLNSRLRNGISTVGVRKNGKDKRIRINDLIKTENPNLVDIPEYEGLYKFDKLKNQVFGIKRNEYLKNWIDDIDITYYRVALTKNNKNTKFLLHRLIFQAHNPTINISNLFIDHINNNKLDNNINNLRLATSSQNCMNRELYNNPLGERNIRETKYGYNVRVTKEGKRYSKTLKTLEEAIEWRNIKLVELHGEFANLG